MNLLLLGRFICSPPQRAALVSTDYGLQHNCPCPFSCPALCVSTHTSTQRLLTYNTLVFEIVNCSLVFFCVFLYHHYSSETDCVVPLGGCEYICLVSDLILHHYALGYFSKSYRTVIQFLWNKLLFCTIQYMYSYRVYCPFQTYF